MYRPIFPEDFLKSLPIMGNMNENIKSLDETEYNDFGILPY